ncbi:hypothetical protein CsSME_00054170 [Camellia sinensis var. sinensis]
MGGLKSKNHYEAIRTAQILHNQNRLDWHRWDRERRSQSFDP